MINALPTAWTVRALVFVVVALCASVIWLHSPTDAGRLLAAAGAIVMTVNVLILLLTVRPVFGRFHRWTQARVWWFPLLDGEWDGEIWSNWARLETTLSAARGGKARFNPLTHDLAEGTEKPTKIEATICSSLFEIVIDTKVPGTNRTSKTLFVRPQWRRPESPRLTYVFEQVDQGPVSATDVPNHLGAGDLIYFAEADELRGQFWTQRQGSKGLNTAGTLVLRRRKPGPQISKPTLDIPPH
ncbi:hypothetical protein [Phenylobacterium sp.]|uniref:hypothetical protein n=1 Tax=Phenylobacterium sp. TaxID=1871053 RepID=UPI003BABBE60